jgi:hypothetical protein
MNSDSRELPRRRNCLAIAAHLRDRAPKHERQAEAKKQFADDFCFHVIYFPFLVLAFFDFSSLRTHFWPSLSAKIPAGTRKVSEEPSPSFCEASAWGQGYGARLRGR